MAAGATGALIAAAGGGALAGANIATRNGSASAARSLPTVTTITPLPTLPAATTTPASAKTSIKHIVIFMKENHTFDNLFAQFPGANGQVTGQHAPDQLASDMSHSHEAALAGATPMGYEQYYKQDIPNYWTYARNFTLCDNFFSEVFGPSPANHLMLIAGQSPFIDYPAVSGNEGWACPNACWDFPTILDRVADKGLTWRNYWSAPWGDDLMVSHLLDSPFNLDYTRFIADASQGDLPSLAIVKTSGELSDHPPQSMTQGENYQVREINAIIQGGLWENTAIFVTWDDWGGFYDHVTPPVLETWVDGTPFRYGFRVPLLVMGGYAKQGHISHTQGSFVSLTRFVEKVFGVDPLTQRDASANDLLDCFDFTTAPTQPVVLVERPVLPRPLPPNPYIP